jgi:DUF1009 family protein
MTFTFDDYEDGSQFPVTITHGTLAAGCVVFVEGHEGADRRIYRAEEIDKTTVRVKRLSFAVGVFE